MPGGADPICPDGTILHWFNILEQDILGGGMLRRVTGLGAPG